MQKKEKAVIFDMDGLLLDTEPLWGESMMRVAQNNKIELSYPELRFTTGMRIYEVTAYWAAHFPWGGTADSNQVAEEILDDIIANAKANAKVMKGVLMHLDFLKSQHYKLAAATSSPTRMAHELLSYFELDSYFQSIACGDEVSHAKPHPEVYLLAAERLRVASYNCIALEDSINGMIAAKAARMQVVAIPEAAKLKDPAFGLATAIFPSMQEMPLSFWEENG